MKISTLEKFWGAAVRRELGVPAAKSGKTGHQRIPITQESSRESVPGAVKYYFGGPPFAVRWIVL